MYETLGSNTIFPVPFYTSVSCFHVFEAYTQLYLPFYSDMAKERRKRVQDGTLDARGNSNAAGSMWKNVDDAAKRRAAEPKPLNGGGSHATRGS